MRDAPLVIELTYPRGEKITSFYASVVPREGEHLFVYSGVVEDEYEVLSVEYHVNEEERNLNPMSQVRLHVKKV